MGKVKTKSSMSIPGNCMVKVKCKTRVPFDASEKEILFSPLLEFTGDNDLIFYESTATLKRGKS